MRAVITGAGGFVGANLVRSLLVGGHDPVAVVRPGSDHWRLADVADDVALAEVDLADTDQLTRRVTELRPDVIFHLAAHGAYSWQTDFNAMLATNLAATQGLLGVAEETGARLVNAGSSSEYGYQDHPPEEDEFVSPNSLYAVTKVGATHLCRLAATRGVHAVTLRLYSIYGPWEEPGRLMPTLVAHCLGNTWPPLVAPETARDFVWVGDACKALVCAGELDLGGSGGVFNIASGTQTTLRELVATAQDVFAPEQPPEWGTMEGRSWDTSTWVGAPEAADRVLGWRATTPMRDGLVALAEWLQADDSRIARYVG